MHEEKIVQWKTGKRKDAEKATNTKERMNNRRRLKTKRIAHTFGTSWTFFKDPTCIQTFTVAKRLLRKHEEQRQLIRKCKNNEEQRNEDKEENVQGSKQQRQ